MLNLLRSDLFRLIRGKALWVMTAVLVACMALSAAMLNWVSQPEFLAFYAQTEQMTADEVCDEMRFEETSTGLVTVGADDGAVLGASPDGTLVAVAGAAPTPEDFEAVTAEMRRFSGVTALFGSFMAGGLLLVVTSLITALFLASDFETRFVRNLPMGRRGRTAYYVEKLLLVALVALWFLAVLATSCAASFAVAGFSFPLSEGIGGLLAWLLLTWMAATAYGWLTALTVWVTRSKGAAIAEALVVSSTFLAALVIQLLGYFARVIPWLGAVPEWLPSSAVEMLGRGADALAAPGGALGFAGVSGGASVLLVLALWLAVCATVALAACRRRDL